MMTILSWKNIVRMPNNIRTITAINKYVPIPVKSYFVWSANIVRAKQITAVIPTAINTCEHFETGFSTNLILGKYGFL